MNAPGATHPSADGFNLLPWRAHAIAQARRRRFAEWGAALLLGLACAAIPMGWQIVQQRRLDVARARIERSLAQLRAPLAEYSRLQRDATTRQQRSDTAAMQSRPLTRLLDLFDTLGAARTPGIALQQITHDAQETTLRATVDDEASADAWLAQLRTVRNAQGVSVPELKRVTPAPRANAPDAPASSARHATSAQENAPLQMTVHLLWQRATGSPPRER